MLIEFTSKLSFRRNAAKAGEQVEPEFFIIFSSAISIKRYFVAFVFFSLITSLPVQEASVPNRAANVMRLPGAEEGIFPRNRVSFLTTCF